MDEGEPLARDVVDHVFIEDLRAACVRTIC